MTSSTPTRRARRGWRSIWPGFAPASRPRAGGGAQPRAAERCGTWPNWRDHLGDRADFFPLRRSPGIVVCLELLEPGAGFKLEFALPGQWPSLLQALRALPIVACPLSPHPRAQPPRCWAWERQLGVSWDFTAHDFYMMCPNISLTDANDRYCGEQGERECARCLQRTAVPGRIGHVQPGAPAARAPAVTAHATSWCPAVTRPAASPACGRPPMCAWRRTPTSPRLRSCRSPRSLPLSPGAPLRVAVIGASAGSRAPTCWKTSRCWPRARAQPVEFHLIGYAYRDLRKQPRAALTVHGAYDEKRPAGPAVLAEARSGVVSGALARNLQLHAQRVPGCRAAGRGARYRRLRGAAQRAPMELGAGVGRGPRSWLAFFGEVRETNFATGASARPAWGSRREPASTP